MCMRACVHDRMCVCAPAGGIRVRPPGCPSCRVGTPHMAACTLGCYTGPRVKVRPRSEPTRIAQPLVHSTHTRTLAHTRPSQLRLAAADSWLICCTLARWKDVPLCVYELKINPSPDHLPSILACTCCPLSHPEQPSSAWMSGEAGGPGKTAGKSAGGEPRSRRGGRPHRIVRRGHRTRKGVWVVG
jgi:hypothetical protein